MKKSCATGVKSVIASQNLFLFSITLYLMKRAIRSQFSKRYEKMARATPFCTVYYTLELEAAICGHHVYQSKWTPELDMKLKCEFDRRNEAVENDENTIGVYLWGEEGKESGLVGYLPIELSKLS